MREMAHRIRIDLQTAPGRDRRIRSQILSGLGKQKWAPDIKVEVRDGIVELSGVITNEKERQGLIVLVENVPGVKEVHDHLVWVEPMSGMAFASAEDEVNERAALP
jgi:osmotically-inducible protein OsmY